MQDVFNLLKTPAGLAVVLLGFGLGIVLGAYTVND